MGNQHFLLPQQPVLNDLRPRNAFGFLTDFGKAVKAYYRKQDEAKAKMKGLDDHS